MVNDVRLTQESALRELRVACRFLGISKNGSKASVWRSSSCKVVNSTHAVCQAYRNHRLSATPP